MILDEISGFFDENSNFDVPVCFRGFNIYVLTYAGLFRAMAILEANVALFKTNCILENRLFP